MQTGNTHARCNQFNGSHFFLLVRTSVMTHMIVRVHDISWRSLSRNWQLRTSERYCLKTNNMLVNISETLMYLQEHSFSNATDASILLLSSAIITPPVGRKWPLFTHSYSEEDKDEMNRWIKDEKDRKKNRPIWIGLTGILSVAHSAYQLLK